MVGLQRIFLNLHGRICAEGLLVFGIGGIAVVYVIAPLIDNTLKNVNEKVLKMVCVILASVFIADLVYAQIHPNAGEGITHVAQTDIKVQSQ